MTALLLSNKQVIWNQLLAGAILLVLGTIRTLLQLLASNEITLGDSNIATLRCQVTSITALSDQRDKTAIEDLDLGLKFVNSDETKKVYLEQKRW